MRLLDLLTAAGRDWVSGEAISTQLGISRAAVWKQIEALRAEGYEVEAAPRRGYRLAARPDKLSVREIEAGLTTQRFGRPVEAHEAIGSTNERAKELARSGAPEGLLVTAEQQTAGKGRLGRPWQTPAGRALAMSVLLRPPIPPTAAPRLTLVAAVAVAEAVRAVTGLPVGIKWPNDLQIAGRKLCGILTEMEAEIEQVRFVVLGIGLNVNQAAEEFPPELRETATSLRLAAAEGSASEGGLPVARLPLLQAILARLEVRYDQFLAGGWPELLAAWRELSVTLGRSVRVIPASGAPIWEGTAVDVDAEGALLVRRPDGSTERVIAGEVSIRPTTA
ncbi:MAG TPA: biotin--[acetyl-CoA-carboxylase] ligase [Symbiobacteriaceae bacterium]|nr:biotin--[acetyl-CoA-carboxylase] ligase [Symbiobacteriaceae bacterium]